MKIGIISTSNKENEKRYPLHLEHIDKLTEVELESIYFETNYPEINYSKNISHIKFLTRDEIFIFCDLVILPKPTKEDYHYFRNGQIFWGWPHAVQDFDFTQNAIEKKLTIIAWENMYKWNGQTKLEHVFLRNNELAGFASVVHCHSLLGITSGIYGKELSAAVIGYGSTGRGAVNALKSLGSANITVFTRRDRSQISDVIPNVKFDRYEINEDSISSNGVPFSEKLSNYDLIINCVLQDPVKPAMFIRKKDLDNFHKRTIIIDVSCDKGMGFEFAVPTSFEKPIIYYNNITYYAVDHTPAYYYNAASYEISSALFPFLKYIINTGDYLNNHTLEKACDIINGNIINQKIIKFQKRKNSYPHELE